MKKRGKKNKNIIEKEIKSELKDKRGASFGTIVAVVGAILIALGFAWLLAQNWHNIPDLLKVTILVGFIVIAYIVAIVLREFEYSGIAKSLFVVGALLYTLSVFLIAQIFNLINSIQMSANLLLISWIGVTLAAYLFSSYTSLIIALVEFLFWISNQFNALIVSSSFRGDEIDEIFGIFGFFSGLFGEGVSLLYSLFLFLIAGIFFYGLSVWHRNFQHKFSKLFTFWAAFYLLCLVYSLSFQYVVQMVWSGQIDLPGAGILFLSIFAIIAFLVIVSGIFIAFSKSSISGKEILGLFLIFIILFGLIFLTSISSNKIGICYAKNCYDFNTQKLCESASANLNCWWNNGCIGKTCYDYKNENSCNNVPSNLNCWWVNDKCEKRVCYQITGESECKSNYDKLGCEWKNERCSQILCSFIDKTSCESVPKGAKCKWGTQYYSSTIGCYQSQDSYSCVDYNNKKSECSSHNECRWYPIVAWSKAGEIPISIWFVWIIINIFFILFILAIIGYGTLIKSKAIINLGIIFFILDIITRYIGFIMDLWGYTSLAVISIIGGILLIILGWFISWITLKWRKKLIDETESGLRE